MASDLIERLTKCALGSADEDVMVRWDKIRAILKQDKGGTWPRECFESIIDGYAEDCEDAVREITSLRTALAIERERAEKAERELRLKAGLVDEAVSAFKGHKAQLQAKLDSAEASLAEAKWLLKPFGQNPGASSLAKVYAHLTRQHAQDAARFLAQEEGRPSPKGGPDHG